MVRTCSNCGSDKTYTDKIPHEHWYNHNNLWYCKKCQNNLFSNSSRIRIWFKQKQIMLKEDPKKGICSWCGYEGLTHIHHLEYHESEPLKDTIELCASCHRRQHV